METEEIQDTIESSDEKIIFIVGEGCPSCDAVKSVNQDNIEQIDINDPRAKEYLGNEEVDVTIPKAFDKDHNLCTVHFEDGALTVLCNDKVLYADSEMSILKSLDDSVQLDEDGGYVEHEEEQH